MITVIKIGFAFLLLLLVGRDSAEAALATDCTLYVATNGIDTNSGSSPTTPKTLRGASSISKPGDIICLLGGVYNLSSSFYPAHNGTANAWIVYKNYGDSDVQFIWIGGANASDLNMIHFYSPNFSTSKSYIEIRGFKLDGQNAATVGIKCAYSHHLRFVGNTIQNTGASGIATKFCDYLTAASNKIHHTGYNQGWSSGISYNSHQWVDAYPGFHSFVINNIVDGNFDGSSNHSDGNGVIMDLSNNSYDYSTANTPPVLIANNVIYGNGGRCIEVFVVTNIWTVNNTCYKNGLDLTESGIGELVTNNANSNYFINNIAYAWNGRPPYQTLGSNAHIVYYKNLYYGGSNNVSSSDPSQFVNADPQFISAPSFNDTNGGQYSTTPPPDQVGNGLSIQATSPAIDKGIDPTTIPGIIPEIVAALRSNVFTDINGTSRPQGNGFDIGAYEYKPALPSLPLAPISLQIHMVQ